MKAIFTLVLPLMLVLTACEQNEYQVPNQTVIVDIDRNNWGGDASQTFYSTDIDLPELDNYLHERGGILVYLSFDGRSYEPIPHTYLGASFSFEARPGVLRLRIESTDGVTKISRPSFMTAKIVLIESDY